MASQRWLFLAASLAVLALVAPSAQATPTCTSGARISCYHVELNGAIAGVIGQADIEASITHPDVVARSNSVLRVGVAITVDTAVTNPVVTYTATDLVGCTSAAAVTAAVNTAQSYQGWADFKVTMTATECSGYIATVLSGGIVSTQVMNMLLPFSVYTNEASDTIASWPTLNVAQSGAWSITVAGGLTVTLAPGGSIAVTGIPDTQQELQAVADAIQALTALHGSSVLVDVVDDTTADGMLTVPASAVSIGNNTVTVPSEFTVHACGAPDDADPCTPIQASTLVGAEGSDEGWAGVSLADLAAGVLFIMAAAAAMAWRRFITALLATLAAIGAVVTPWPFPVPFGLIALPVGLWIDQFVDPERVSEFFSKGAGFFRGQANKGG